MERDMPEELLYEGKAKKLFITEDPQILRVEYKDDATAFNGKKEVRPGRKMGHLNLSMENPSELLETLIKLQVWDQDSLERMLN